ncbi:purine-nucleoside phosphorylase [Thalassoglobus sp. JC818]|uniref:purine-nucleoside phosphorylase n=1 Tax=Thalassoglobus sp. JC818 TaxID=3232136 RepID=UPI00345A1D95
MSKPDSGHPLSHLADLACQQIRTQYLDTLPTSSELPKIAIVLGTGFGGFTESLDIACILKFEDLEGFEKTTATGHLGRFIIGRVGSCGVIVLQGRPHFYEGHHVSTITYPMEVLSCLGVETVFLSCAAGGLSSHYQVGDLMLIRDHVNFLQARSAQFGDRAPLPREKSVDDDLLTAKRLQRIARRHNFPLHEGTYIAVPGPNYETRAELRFFRRIGEAIGMSTVPEVIHARRCGMKTIAVAAITNLCLPDAGEVADGDHVVQVAQSTLPRFQNLVTDFLKQQDI